MQATRCHLGRIRKYSSIRHKFCTIKFSFRFRQELSKVYELIFNDNSTVEDKTAAYLTLQTWKTRRADETLNGILCTLSLLDVHLKDVSGKIKDPFTLSTLYSSSLTKFINFATSFELYPTSMYKSAAKIGLDSFLIDLRHVCAHGKQQPSIQVFRKSHQYCLDWIKKFFWEPERNNVTNAKVREMRCDEVFAAQLKDLLTFYDVLCEILHKNISRFEDLSPEDKVRLRWPKMDKFMRDNRMQTFRHAFKIISTALMKLIQSKAMRTSPQTFFYEMFERCEFLMTTSEVVNSTEMESSDEDEEIADESLSDTSTPKRREREPTSVVNLNQNLIWEIVKHDHLKLLLDMLYQTCFNQAENAERKASARFWITIILGSFRHYQKYCEFSESNAVHETKITNDVRKIYSYQLDADLSRVFVLVGTQLLPSSLKYSKEFYMQLIQNIDEDNESICVSLLPFVYPPLTSDQLESIGNLMKIGTSSYRKVQKPPEEKIYTIEDLLSAQKEKKEDHESEIIWEKSTDNVDWSSQPIGTEFSL